MSPRGYFTTFLVSAAIVAQPIFDIGKDFVNSVYNSLANRDGEKTELRLSEVPNPLEGIVDRNLNLYSKKDKEAVSPNNEGSNDKGKGYNKPSEQKLKKEKKEPKKIEDFKGLTKYVGNEVSQIEEMLGVAYAGDLNPRDNLRSLGWEVYDDPGLKKRPKREYEYSILPDRFSKNLNDPSQNLRNLFSNDELAIISELLDKELSNDELKFIFVTTDNYLTFTSVTQDRNIGKNGIYTLLKKMTRDEADRIRKISPYYR